MIPRRCGQLIAAWLAVVLVLSWLAGGARATIREQLAGRDDGPAAVYSGDLDDIGTLGGGISVAGGIDSAGDVVGDATLAPAAGQESGGSFHAILAAPGQNPTDLGSLRTEDAAADSITGNSRALAISPGGHAIAGWSETNDPSDAAADPQTFHPVVWTGAGTTWNPTDLGQLDPSADPGSGCPGDPHNLVGFASAINDSGTAVGEQGTTSDCPSAASGQDSPDLEEGSVQAFRWTAASGMQSLGTLLGGTSTSCIGDTQAWGINSAGAIVGSSQVAGGDTERADSSAPSGCTAVGQESDPDEYHAFYLPAGAGPGAMVDLGNPAGGTGQYDSASAESINDKGQVVVDGYDSGDEEHAYIWSQGQGFTDAGTLGGDAWLNAINNGGVAVGNSATNGAYHAAAWIDGQLVDLNGLLGAGSPWTLVNATAIDDAGEIAGIGTENGNTHAFRLTVSPQGATIISQPASQTNSRSATFAFTDGGSSSITFKCALDPSDRTNPDDPAYRPCASPVTYTSLSAGDHSFSVIADQPGLAPSDPEVSTWTINAQRPTVIVDSAPSSPTTDTNFTFTFHASEQGGAGGQTFQYTCQIDGGLPFSCQSPFYATRGPGAHSLSLTATDAQGNTSPTPTVVNWTVVAPASTDTTAGTTTTATTTTAAALPAATTTCAAPAQASATVGLLSMIGRNGTCLQRTTVDGQTGWQADGTVTINGIRFSSYGDSTIAVTPTEITAHGRIAVSLGFAAGSVADNLFSFDDSDFTWHVSTSGALQFESNISKLLLSAAAGESEAFGGLGLHTVQPLAIDLSSDNGGTAKITVTLNLPDRVFHSIPTTGTDTNGDAKSAEDVSFSYVLTTSNQNGLTGGAKLDIADAWIGTFHLKDLEIAYDAQSNTWTGQGGIVLPIPNEATTVRSELLFSLSGGGNGTPGIFGGWITGFSIALQHANIPIGSSGVFLQKLGVAIAKETGTVNGVQQAFPTFTGSAAISLGPDLPVIETPVVQLNGSVRYAWSNPWSLTLGPVTGTLFGYPLGNASVTYTSGVGVTLSGNVTMELAGYGFQESLLPNSFFTALPGRPQQFNIGATGSAQLPYLGRFEASAVWSDIGYAACAVVPTRLGAVAIGVGVHLPSGRESAIGGACDLSPYSDTASASALTPTGSPDTLALAASSRPRLLAIEGVGAAPDITVTGPGGLSLTGGPDVANSRGAAGIAFPAPGGRHVTYVLIADRLAGSYRVTSSNVPISSIQTAAALARPLVHARVTASAGGRRRLSFSQTPAPGQTLELFEQGSGGTGRMLIRTAKSHGTLTFVPAPGIGTRRHILAVITSGGLPRARMKLAAYTVATPRAGRIHTVRRAGRTITWAPASGASSYALTWTSARGVTRSETVTRPRASAPASAVSLLIVAVAASGQPGPPLAVTLAKLPRGTSGGNGRGGAARPRPL